jgi:MinD-like ATPase involved in chromosome partitioning or flagellar assembly
VDGRRERLIDHPVEHEREPAEVVSLRRRDVYQRPLVEGRETGDTAPARFSAWLKRVTTSSGERAEQALDDEIRRALVTRCNRIAVVSPKGGVGKTTCTFLAGNLLASHPRLRVLAMDANRDFGTLASLAPDSNRVERSLADLLSRIDRISSATELVPYVSRISTGLHVMAAPARPEVMAQLTPELYGELLEFVGAYYDVILLDLGTGIIDPLAQFGIERADQTLVVTTPEFVTAEKVLGALRYLRGDDPTTLSQARSLTVVLNGAGNHSGGLEEIGAAFRDAGVPDHVAIPYDDRLRVMLDSATYEIDSLGRGTRMAIKGMGATVAHKLA